MPTDDPDLDFSLGGYSPDEYLEAVQNHTQDVLRSVEKELEVEEEIKQQAQEIEEIDQGIVEDLREVLDIFGTYIGDMERFAVFVVKMAEDEGVRDSAVIFGRLADKVGSGDLQFEHPMEEVLRNIQKVHNDLMDAFNRLQKKDEKLSDIEDELQRIANEDRNLEQELEAIENMVDHMGNMAAVYEEVSHDVDPTQWDFSTS